MRQLIIGCGYLGTHVAQHWLARGDEVFALTRSPTRAVELSGIGIQPIVGDILAPGGLDFPDRIDCCLYAIALDRSSGRTKREVYCDGIGNVFRAKGFRPSSLIYISSTSVYGQSDGGEIDENSATTPPTENGQICLAAERLAARYDKGRCCVLRLSGIYGPNRLLARVEQLRARVPLTGNPDAWLNLIHRDDASQAVIQCEMQGRAGEIYLVSDDRPIRRREYYSTLARLVDAPEPVFQADSQTLGKRCCNRKATAELDLAFLFPTIDSGLPNSLETWD